MDIAAAGVTTTGDSLWKFDGSYWERVTNNADIDLVQASPEYDTDSCVFYADLTANTIYRSNDGGNQYRAQLGSHAPMNGWQVLDAQTLLISSGGSVFKTANNGTTWGPPASGTTTAGTIVNFAVSPDYDSDSTVLCGDNAGRIFRSTDAGRSFSAIARGGFGGNTTTFVAFDAGYADNGTIYAASSDGTNLIIERYKDGDEWRDIGNAVGQAMPIASTATGATGMATGPDGSLYISDAFAAGALRCLNPTAPAPPLVEWEHVTKDITVPLNNLQVTGGSNKLWGYNGPSVWSYTDTLLATVALSSPDDGSETGRINSATLSWDKLAGAVRYQVMVNTSPNFRGVSPFATGSTTTSLTSIVVSGLEAGQTYYWKVRADRPLLSRWAREWSFTTALGAPQWNPFVGGVPEAPYNGATNVSRTPSFAWNPADWATGYEFILAKDAAFSDVVTGKTGANALSGTVYLCEETLDYSTTYYWKVRAISKTTNSEWASAVFTTEAQPAAPPTSPTPTPEPEEEPLIDPIYLWVIIGIGAVLVIALIILIVRTRRVA
jgi:hypothetical protein